MEHSPLIAVLVIGLGLAFVLGTAVQRIRLPPLVGYLLAGVVLGPTMLTAVSIDQHLTLQLADIGVVLLMFGVGLHFHPRDLLDQLMDIARFLQKEPQLEKELLDAAVDAYFVKLV